MRRLVLGLESSGEHQSAALIEARAGDDADGVELACRLLGEVRVVREARAPDVLLELVAGVCERAGTEVGELALIAVGRGPGSFTGVRVGLAVAEGLSLASGVPVWPVSTLEALALNALWPGREVLALIDARRGEVYAGLYRLLGDARMETLLAPRATTCEAAVREARQVTAREVESAAPAAGERMVMLGSGALAYGVGDRALPRAAHVVSASAVAERALALWREAGWDAARAPAVDAAYLRKSEAEIAADLRDGARATGGV